MEAEDLCNLFLLLLVGSHLAVVNMESFYFYFAALCQQFLLSILCLSSHGLIFSSPLSLLPFFAAATNYLVSKLICQYIVRLNNCRLTC